MKSFVVVCLLAASILTAGSVFAQDLVTNTPLPTRTLVGQEESPTPEATITPSPTETPTLTPTIPTATATATPEPTLTASPTDLPTLMPTVQEVISTPEPTTDSAEVVEVSVPISDAALSDGDGLEIVDLIIRHTANTIEQVTMTIENTSDAPLDAVGWYLLAPSRIAEEAWRFAEYVAPVELIDDLEPGQRATLSFLGPEAAVLGDFKLSAWVHRVNADGTTTHADGVGFETPLTLGPPLFLTVEHVEWFAVPDSAEGERFFYVTLSLRNYSSLPAEVTFSYSLATPGIETPWENGVFSLPYESLILLPNSQLTLTTRNILPISPDSVLQVIGYLQEKVGDSFVFRNNYAYPDLIEFAG